MIRAVIIIAPLLAAGAGQAAETDARKSIAMLSHWECFQWASMQNDSAAAEAHFTAGLSAGQQFMEAALAGTITPEEAWSTVPVIVSLTMSGPNKDFVLGRLFEQISSSAYSDIATKDPSGMPLAPADYILDDEYLANRAQTEYREGNCAVLLD